MLKKIQFSLLLLFTFVQYNFAYNTLTVGDPRASWWTTQGNIDEAVLTVRPKGIYMEMGLYLTFSAKGTNFNQYDTLEVVLDFELPKNAMINDSWLWVGDDIIKAEVIDKWSAFGIYEEIVGRRQDPSILVKQSDTQYQLRIFPMAGGDTRKVKISYLVPTSWTAQAVSAVLPIQLIKASKSNPDLLIRTWIEGNWQNPRISEVSTMNFTAQSNEEWGNFYEVTIPKNNSFSSLTFTLDAPLKNGVYLSRFEENDANIYQLAFLPSSLLNNRKPQKIAILLDYQDSKSTTTKEEIISYTKTFIHNNLSPSDQFNLFFSHSPIHQVSDEWLPADTETINQTFEDLENPLSNYSNLPSLLATGIEFIKTKEQQGSLLLISNSDQVGSESIAHELLNDLTSLISDHEIPVNILDFQNRNLSYNWIGWLAYRGNEYFYTNFSKITGGNYVNVRNNISVYENLVSLFQSFSALITSFDFHTTLENGFCHSRFTLGSTEQVRSINQPILQIGKFEGNFPFELEMGGVLDSEVFFQTLSIPEEDVFEADGRSQEIWSGNYLNELENIETTNTIIQEIISTSIDERVLSLYTAMLCLEPSMGGEICFDCTDESEGEVVDIFEEELLDSLFTIEAYPNPFKDKAKISVNLSKNVNINQLQFGIYNYLGQLVRTFEPQSRLTNRKLEFEWDGTDSNNQNLTKGIYFFIVQTPTKAHSLKLMYY